MNYNELQLINIEYGVMENEILEALANEEIEYFEFLSQNAYKAMVLDLIAKEIKRYNGEEIMRNIREILTV